MIQTPMRSQRAEIVLKIGIATVLPHSGQPSLRSGCCRSRGRKYRTPKSILLVLSENNDSEKAFRNLSGVDVTTSKNLNTELLAPGGDPGRLVVFSKSAVSALGERL